MSFRYPAMHHRRSVRAYDRRHARHDRRSLAGADRSDTQQSVMTRAIPPCSVRARGLRSLGAVTIEPIDPAEQRQALRVAGVGDSLSAGTDGEQGAASEREAATDVVRWTIQIACRRALGGCESPSAEAYALML